jgi:hypothetical protein
MSRFLVRLAPLAAVVAIALPAHAQKKSTAFIAPNDQTITSWVEESQGERAAHVIWVRNASTVPIQVFAVSLRDCENVRGSCGTMNVKTKVAPGGRTILKRVEPRDPTKGFGYRHSFSWHPDSSDVAALKALAEAGDPNAQQQLALRAEQSAARSATIGNPNYQLDQAAIVALGDRIHALRLEPDSIVVPVTGYFLAGDIRVFAVDAQGQVLGRVRAFNWRVMPTSIQVLADTVLAVSPGRSRVEFALMPPAAPVGAELSIIVTPAPK